MKLRKYRTIEITTYIVSDHNWLMMDFKSIRNNRKYSKLRKYTINDNLVMEEVKKIKISLELDANEISKLWDTMKEFFRAKFIALSTHIKILQDIC